MTALRLGACVVAALLAIEGCDLSGTPPSVDVYAGSDATGTPIAPGQAYFVADPLAQSLTLFVSVTAGNSINSMRCTRDGRDIEPATTSGGGLAWSRTYEVPLDLQHELIELRVLDRMLNETVRAVHIYHNPDIIDEVFVAGRRSDRIQAVWAGDPVHLIVSLHDDVVGSYAVTVLVESWNGVYLPLGAAEPATAALAFPGTPGRYRYTVRAEDAATGVFETVEFLAFVQGISVTDDWASPGPGYYTHAASGRNLTVIWGYLDGAVGAGLWVVEVDAATLSLAKSYSSGTGSAVPFEDIGDYVVRVGVREDAASSYYRYSSRRYSGYSGTNSVPSAPVPTNLTPTLSASTGGTFSFDVGATDADGDTLVYNVSNVDLPDLSVTYNTQTAAYDLSYLGSSGTFGKTVASDPAWELLWTVPANTFPAAGPFTLSFTASDPFGGYSTALLLVFTVTL